MTIYVIRTCELGQAGKTIHKPSKKQITWGLRHKFLCNVNTIPKPKEVVPIAPIVEPIVTEKPKEEQPKIETKPPGRSRGRPSTRIRTEE